MSSMMPQVRLAPAVVVICMFCFGCGETSTSPQAKAPSTSSTRTERNAADKTAAGDAAQPETKTSTSDKAATNDGPRATDAADASVPDASVEELLTQLNRLNAVQLEEATREAVAEFSAVQRRIIQVADRLLAKKGLEDDVRFPIIVQKWNAAILLVNLGEEGAEDRFIAIANELARDPNPKLAKIARLQLLQLDIRQNLLALLRGSSKSTDRLFEQIGVLLAEEDLGAGDLNLVRTAAPIFESLEEYERAAKIYSGIADAFKSSKDADLADLAVELSSFAAKRLGWFGRKAELAGTRLDGEAFDLSEYKGKVVLVDFWATWCGACLAELPNVKSNYDKFHDRGFEVVGVNRDDDKEAADTFVAGDNPTKEPIPWVTLWSDESSKEAEKNSLAHKFGVDALPATFLVDQDGKVIAIGIRGNRLEERLSELLGAPDEQPDAKKAEG